MQILSFLIALCFVANSDGMHVSETADTTRTLKTVNVTADALLDAHSRTSQSSIQVKREYMESHFAGSLMQTLEGLPGVKAMSVGSGQSKPIIRGLGFNRMVVTEDGVKHEGQQWGEDHGLEIDQFAIDRAEVVKGPAALLHGSDAIGGVLNLYTNHIPVNPFDATVQLFGRSNNGQMGASAKFSTRQGNWFVRGGATFSSYADYRVPTDSIQYYSYWIRLRNGRLRNTAGREADGHVVLGYAGYNFHTDLRVSETYSRSGFFADAHGLEVRLSDIDYDRSRRDIDLPYQWVSHLKVRSHTTWRDDVRSFEFNLAYQNNLREEHSEPIAHGYMPTPDGTLERRFLKHTFSVNAIGHSQLRDWLALSYGVNVEHQRNRRDGWGFIIPDFEQTSYGLFAMTRIEVRPNLHINGGVRFDQAHLHTHEYRDWYATPQADGTTAYVQRSADQRLRFTAPTWSLGANYNVGQWSLKANVGKSFRVPIAKELAADGINYHIFRYERGNSDLNAEEAYQVDVSALWTNGALRVQVEPFFNYFPNYIYLNPTSDYVEGLQLYAYTQAKVIRWGFEAEAVWAINKHWDAELRGDYLWARQKSGDKRGYGLPFAPPWSITPLVRYSFDWHGRTSFEVSANIVGAQNDIVPPESPTDGYWRLDAAATKHFQIGRKTARITLRATNILNKRYYDHTSYYRLIDVPEPGFNLSGIFAVEL